MYFIKRLFIRLTVYIFYKLNYFNSFKKSRFEQYFHLILILLLGSSHPTRIKLFINKSNNEDAFNKINWKLNKNKKNIYIFIGDSHAELYGRNYQSNLNKNSEFITFWLGPKLLITFIKSNYTVKIIISLLNKIINFYGEFKYYHIIFSFGEIDIRGFFYRMLNKERHSKTLEMLLKEYSNKIPKRIEEIKNKLNNKTITKFYFIEPPPTTYKEGRLPQNIQEIKKIHESTDFPVLGHMSDRILWRSSLVRIISENNPTYTFLKISKMYFDVNNALNQNISDGIHINSEELIIEFQKNLIQLNKA